MGLPPRLQRGPQAHRRARQVSLTHSLGPDVRWCASPATQTTVFPESMEWEPLADVIRGKVKVK